MLQKLLINANASTELSAQLAALMDKPSDSGGFAATDAGNECVVLNVTLIVRHASDNLALASRGAIVLGLPKLMTEPLLSHGVAFPSSVGNDLLLRYHTVKPSHLLLVTTF